jgi:uncharacterized membrane protein YeiH
MLYFLDLFGSAVFAITGTLASGHKKMDLFGVVVVAVVTALGGGTLRDVVLGITPVFWISDPTYLVVVVAAALFTFAFARFTEFQTGLLLIGDAFGLAIFTIIGAQKALNAQVSPTIAIVMGVMTGVAGGIVRDILCGEIPLILRKEIYATASLLGGSLFVVLSSGGIKGTEVTIGATALIVSIRLAALHWNISLPVFMDKNTKRPKTK